MSDATAGTRRDWRLACEREYLGALTPICGHGPAVRALDLLCEAHERIVESAKVSAMENQVADVIKQLTARREGKNE